MRFDELRNETYQIQIRSLEVEVLKDRVILHSDCNCFYASVEMLHRPECRHADGGRR